MAAGMPVLANLPDMSSPGVMIVHLIGSSRLKPSARSPKPCHLSPALSTQSSAWPMPSAASLSGPQTLNHQSLAELLVDLAHRAAEVQRLAGCSPPPAPVPPGGFHHRRGHVAAGDDGVLRAGAGVHQVGLVEEVAVELALLRVLHQHLRGLADAGQQLVRALRGEDQLVLRPRPLLAHRVEAAVEACGRRRAAARPRRSAACRCSRRARA